MGINGQGTGTCSQCGFEQFDEGFLEDMGESSQGYTRWVAGPLERGLLGGARRVGRTRFAVNAFRCRSCGHLAMFAREQI